MNSYQNIIYRRTLLNMFVVLIFLLLTSTTYVEGSRSKPLKNHLGCLYHDLTDTKLHFFNHHHPDVYQNRSIDYITEKWRKTLFNGSFNNKKPFNQMNLRDPETILRLAEYQTMVYCPNITSIKNMSTKNVRVGSFRLESFGNDTTHRIFWYLASNDDQKQLTLVHRGTTIHSRNDILVDLDPILSGARHEQTFRLDFPYLEQNQIAVVAQGFHLRFKNQQRSIEYAIQTALLKYPNYSLVIVGHSLGAAWAYLNAGYLAGKSSISIAALYTFGQPLLGNSIFVDQLAKKIGITKIIRIVNKNDLIPHIGCTGCQQPKEPAEKWISMNNQWIDCQGGHDMKCSSGLPCKELSWTEHSSLANFSMRSEFCQIKINSQ